MDIAQSVADAVATSIAPVAENMVATIVKGVREAISDEIGKFSGKEFQITIKVPDLK